MSDGIDDGKIAKMLYPPGRGEHPSQAAGKVMEQDHLSDEKFRQENEYVGQGRSEEDTRQRQWLRQVHQTVVGHEHSPDDDTEAIQQIADNDGFLIVEQKRYDEKADEAETEGYNIGRTCRYGMYPKMKHPPAQGE